MMERRISRTKLIGVVLGLSAVCSRIPITYLSNLFIVYDKGDL
jgi:hypothetical protein